MIHERSLVSKGCVAVLEIIPVLLRSYEVFRKWGPLGERMPTNMKTAIVKHS